MNATATAVQTKERPIILSGAMVRAILEGRKTQTRRVANFPAWVASVREDFPGCFGGRGFHPRGKCSTKRCGHIYGAGTFTLCCPRGNRGDRLWVREAFAGNGTDAVWYREGAEYPNSLVMKWKPSIHMPRWASRITLEITEVRVERLQEISKDDAIAEGVRVLPLQETTDPSAWYESAPGMNQSRSAEECYRKLWDSINADRGFGWDANPWVWAISFKRVQQ